MYLYNSATHKKEEFKTHTPGHVEMYTCGPTVYHFAHIGNLRSYIMEDVLEKYLRYVGYDVNRVMNITDVGHLTSDADEGEDKMLKGARREHKSVMEIAQYYTDAFFADCRKLNIKRPDVVQPATGLIDDYIKIISRLLEKGYAYVAGGNVYFDTSKLERYYIFNDHNEEDLAVGVREGVEEDTNKRNRNDFVLWFTKSKFEDQALKWDSPWGVGYPGWHIECSGISMKYNGEYLDLHCGGVDNAFPHHTNEIAQSESYLGHPWCPHWCHVAHLNTDHGKMSKSKGEFLTVSLLEEKGYDPLAYRFFCLQSHYRKSLVFTWENLDNATVAYNKLLTRIASDIVPIMGENRILAYHGLKQLNSNPSVGLKAIIDVCGLSEKEITVSDIVFKIGPRINASGRIQNGKEAVDLLTEKDFSVALEKAGQINQYNETRKDLDKTMTEEANQIVAGLEGLADRRSIVLYNEDWHKGVIGIVASRLTEVYYRPAVVLTRTDDMATGSARSVSGFDVYKAIEYCRDLLENFGGHTYAAGLSMKVENVPAFTERFEEFVSRHILPEQTSAVIDINAEIDFRDITPKFCNDLKKFNPFGPDNTKPVFCTHNVYDYGTSKVVGRDQEHIKLELVDNKSNNVMNGIAFGQSSHVRYIKTKRSFDICYTIEENTHKRGEVQLQIEDIKPN